ncbi:MAG: bceB 3 [Herbinix sp.]|jgi:putative ABC transport system permease protein|nr:bceB 3 [Herbinix sp.]
MLNKLALRNAKRSMKDYGIYILSVTLIFSLLYAFNMIIFSEDILMLNDLMKTIKYAIATVSAVIVFVCAWLVHYMNNFMLQRRSKEFGIYMTLGISNRAISQLFLRENMIMGSISFFLSFIAGSFLYQLLTLIIMHIFEASYQVKITFSIKALLLTLLHVCMIYTFSLLRSKRKLSKMKVYQLLYADKKNETMKFKNVKGSFIIFITSLLMGGLGGWLLWYTFSKGEDNVTMARIGLIFLSCLICIYGFYISLSTILVKLFVDNKKIKYKKGIFLIVRSLSAKMNTMRVTLGTLGLLLTLTLTTFSIGMLFKGFFDTQVESSTPYDIAICSEIPQNDFRVYKEYIHQNLSVVGEIIYPIYRSGNRTIYDILEQTSLGGSYFEDDTVMRYSDYQKLRKLLDYPDVNLKNGHFLVQGVSGVKKAIEKVPNLALKLGDQTLQYQGYQQENFALEGINGAYYFIVIPDAIAQSLEIRHLVYAVDTEGDTTSQDYEGLSKLNQERMIENEDGSALLLVRDDIYVKGALLAENRSIFTIFTFSLFYLGLVFMCVAATILAVQQLSDSLRYKFRYKVLSNLGMEEKRMDGYILKQCLFYFGFPMLLPIPFSIYITVCINRILEAYVTKSILATSISTSIGLFLFVYFLYFIATFINYRKNVYE